MTNDTPTTRRNVLAGLGLLTGIAATAPAVASTTTETWERISARAVAHSPEYGGAMVEAARAAQLRPQGFQGIVLADDGGAILYFGEPGASRPDWRVTVNGCERARL